MAKVKRYVETVVSKADTYDDMIAQIIEHHNSRKDRATDSTEVSIFVETLEQAQKIRTELLPKIAHLPFEVRLTEGHKGQWQVQLLCFAKYDLSVFKKQEESTGNTMTIIGLP